MAEKKQIERGDRFIREAESGHERREELEVIGVDGDLATVTSERLPQRVEVDANKLRKECRRVDR